MLATIHSAAIYGIDAVPVTIEVCVSKGIGYQITGLPDESIRESISRIAIALGQCGFNMPRTKLLVHIAPANLRKSGSAFDLPIALGILLASGQVQDVGKLSEYIIAGELSLDGKINPVRGALCMSELAAKKAFKGLVCPIANAHEAALIRQTTVYAMDHLDQVLAFITSDVIIEPFRSNSLLTTHQAYQHDFRNIVGQQRLKRALEITAAGGFHLLINGHPGTGKSALAKCLPSILPPMNEQEILETTKMQSLMNHGRPLQQLITQRPFCEIHPTISDAGLIGGTVHAVPGQITAAHNGVLFMDEFSELRSSVLEALRQPLEERRIIVARAKSTIEYPAAFMLVAAMNPCGCGYHKHPTIKCTCSKRALWWHNRKISGPIRDRFDLYAEAEAIEAEEIFSQAVQAESSATIRDRVVRARTIQSARLRNYTTMNCNAQLTHELIQQFCALDQHAKKFLQKSWDTMHLSMRALDKIVKVARTIADLAGTDNIELPHIAEALSFRQTDQPLQAITPKTSLKVVHHAGQRNDYEQDEWQ